MNYTQPTKANPVAYHNSLLNHFIKLKSIEKQNGESHALMALRFIDLHLHLHGQSSFPLANMLMGCCILSEWIPLVAALQWKGDLASGPFHCALLPEYEQGLKLQVFHLTAVGTPDLICGQ